MRRCWLWFFAFLLAPLLADEDYYHRDPLQKLLLSTHTSALPQVNLVTGELCLQSTDFVVEGVCPLTFRRFYNHQYGKWRFNPETQAFANFEYEDSPCFVSIGTEEGGVILLEKKAPQLFRFDAKQPGFSHEGEAGFHPENRMISYSKLVDPKNPKRFDFRAEMIDGFGTSYIFSSGMYNWHTKTLEKEKTFFTTRNHHHLPSRWIPYQLQIEEIRLASGQKICCEYVELETHEKLPMPRYLSKMSAFTGDHSLCLGYLKIIYHTKEKKKQIEPYVKEQKVIEISTIELLGSDGRRAYYHFDKAGRLSSFKKETGYEERFFYDKMGRLIRVEKPGGDYLKISYDSNNRVAALLAPWGPEGEEVVCCRYQYKENQTTLFYPSGCKEIYHFDNYKRVEKCETFAGDLLHHFVLQKWDAQTGDLVERTLYDEQGRKWQKSAYLYDKFHNLISVDTEGEKKEYLYSQEGRNLLVEEILPSGEKISYSYLPHSNLLFSEMLFAGKKALQRTFYSYDDTGALVKKIIDDGSSPHSEDVSDVTLRKIFTFQNKKTFPCLGKPESVIESAGEGGKERPFHSICYTYTPFGQVAEERHYDEKGALCSQSKKIYQGERLSEEIGPMGEHILYEYDAAGCLILQQGPHPERFIETRYDLAHRPIMEIRGGTLLSEKSYDSAGNLLELINGYGEKTSYSYNPLGQLTEICYPDGGRETHLYDIWGNEIEVTDPKGYKTTKSYDSWGRVQEIFYPDGSRERFSYFPGGRLKEKEERNGVRLQLSYDGFGNVISEEYLAKEESQSYFRKYAFYGPLYEIDPAGVKTSYFYNSLGQKVREVTQEKEICFTYDALGRNQDVIYDDHKVTTLRDRSGRVTCERVSDLHGKPLKEVSYVYQKEGAEKEVFHAYGKSLFRYDGEERIVEEIDAEGGRKRYTYEPGKMCEVDALGQYKETFFNFRGQVQRMALYNASHELLKQIDSFYDLAGGLILRKESASCENKVIVALWERGPLGRIESESFQGRKKQFFYDEKGREILLIKPSGEKLYKHYDGFGRVARFYGPDFYYEYHYDLLNRMTEVYDHRQKKATKRIYDGYGHLLAETLASGLTLHSYYTSQGLRTHLCLPDQSHIDYSYLAGALFKVHRKGYDILYASRDLAGKPTSLFLPEKRGKITISRNGLGLVGSITSPWGKEIYNYNKGGELLSDGRHHYSYDPLHQLKQSDTTDYHFNQLAETLAATTGLLALDSCGNLQNDGQNFFTYDSLDRLTSVTNSEGTFFYEYDPFHRRISKKQGGEKELYLWDGQNEIGKVVDNKIVELRVLGEGLGAEIGAAVLFEIDQKSYLPLHDMRGSLRHLASLASEDVTSFDLPPFGPTEGPKGISPWSYFSKRQDEESALIYFGRRYYHPRLQQWITPDPEGMIDGGNLYAFLHNNPLSQFDLYGLFTMTDALHMACMPFKPLFWGVKMAGEHLIPIPGVRDFVEAVGRFGCGGNFWAEANYRKNYHRIHKIEGAKKEGVTNTYSNGILTSFEKACQDAKERFPGEEIHLFYKASEGFMADVVNYAWGKCGFTSGFDHMVADFYSNTAAQFPEELFFAKCHSGSGIHMMNIASLLSEQTRSRIHLETYGSATLIPPDLYASVMNHVSFCDIVPLLCDPVGYFQALTNHQHHVTFYKTSLSRFFVDHYISGNTYRSVSYHPPRSYFR